tara:strand:+ start:24 stop:326 length:303 start_codon:yes stop_codon:yes gene_type:complete
MAQDNKLELKENEGKAFLQEKKEDWHADFGGQVLCPDGIIRYFNVYKNTAQATGKEWIKAKIGNPIPESAGAGESTPVQNNQPASKPVENISEVEDDLPF